MKFSLRQIHNGDEKSIAKNISNEKVLMFLSNRIKYPYFESDARKYIQLANAVDCKEFIKGIAVEDNIIGVVGLKYNTDLFSKSCEIGYWLGEDYWGKGIMTDAVKLMCKYAFDNIKLNRVEAFVVFENFSSRKVLEKAGFVLEGIHIKKAFKNGNYYDVCSYALLN